MVVSPGRHLRPVQVNTIRSSLSVLARDSSAIGLPQPHLNRTALCELPESSFDPGYLQHRDDLRQHLHATARAKSLRGSPLDGAALADLVEALVAALNNQEFPTAGSMLEAFNQRLMMECSDAHAATLQALPLPVEEVLATAASSLPAKPQPVLLSTLTPCQLEPHTCMARMSWQLNCTFKQTVALCTSVSPGLVLLSICKEHCGESPRRRLLVFGDFMQTRDAVASSTCSPVSAPASQPASQVSPVTMRETQRRAQALCVFVMWFPQASGQTRLLRCH